LASNPASTVTLPGFLVPAFQTTQASARRNFSATTHRPSKLGRTPLSVPPGVELTIGDLFVKKDMTSYLQTSKRKITVTGPLGALELEIPDYVNIDHDAAARRVEMSVKDRDQRNQREMWGMDCPHYDQRCDRTRG
jgi:large subunit ribosomal protein L6